MSVTPEEYFSIRVTVEHNKINDLLALKPFCEADWYICYPHTGKHGDNEHVHIAVPAGNKAYKQRFADSIGKHIGTGNKYFSTKSWQNGLGAGIQYYSHEGTQPITKGDVQQWIIDAPAWVPGGERKKRKLPPDFVDHEGDTFQQQIKLNVYNVVQYAAHFYKSKGYQHEDFKRTLSEMSYTRRYNFVFGGHKIDYLETEFLASIDPKFNDKFIDSLFGFEKSRAMTYAQAMDVIHQYQADNDDESYLNTEHPEPENAETPERIG